MGGSKQGVVNPLCETPTFVSAGSQVNAGTQSAPKGAVRHIFTVEPATGFQFRFRSPAGDARRLHLEREALENNSSRQAEVIAFRAGAYPGEDPTEGGFFTSPDSIPLIASATILIGGAISGDSLICRSFGSWNGLHVTFKLYRENPDGSIGFILTGNLKDADEHTFAIP